MAANININNRFQLNDIIPQNNIQLSAEQKVIKIDQEISVRETYKSSLESSREAWKDYAKLTQESKGLVQDLMSNLREQINNNKEQIDLWKTVIKLKGLDGEKSNTKIINNSENPNKKVISLAKEQVILQKKVEISEKNIIEAGKKIEAIEKYTQKLEVQPTVKKDVVVSTYKPTSTQLSTLVCDNYALNKSDSGAVDIKPKYSLPVIYQSQKNIYESVLNSLLLKLIV